MRDAGCVGSVTGQFADQSDYHGDDPRAEVDDRAHVLYWQEIQPLEHGEVTVEFRVGSQRYLETADELRRCPQRVAFRDVGRDRKGSATNLIDQGEVLAQWSLKGQQVGLVGELLRGAPRIESLELSHAAEGNSGALRATYPNAFTGVRIYASRIPHLASRA